MGLTSKPRAPAYLLQMFRYLNSTHNQENKHSKTHAISINSNTGLADAIARQLRNRTIDHPHSWLFCQTYSFQAYRNHVATKIAKLTAKKKSHAATRSQHPEPRGATLAFPRLGPGVPEAVDAEVQVPEPAVPGEGGGQRLPSDPGGGATDFGRAARSAQIPRRASESFEAKAPARSLEGN